MKKSLRGGPTPAPPTTSVPGAEAARSVPYLPRVVERVGFAVHRGGSLYAGRLQVIEVLQLVSVLVVRLVLRPAGLARGRRSAQYQCLLGSARTPKNGLSLLFLPPKRSPTENCLFFPGQGSRSNKEAGGTTSK